jgi:hypothetical protein
MFVKTARVRAVFVASKSTLKGINAGLWRETMATTSFLFICKPS